MAFEFSSILLLVKVPGLGSGSVCACVCVRAYASLSLSVCCTLMWRDDGLEPVGKRPPSTVTGFDRKQQESFASLIPSQILAQCHMLLDSVAAA